MKLKTAPHNVLSLIGLCFLVVLPNPAAANVFWDPTGTTLNSTANGSWEGNVWAPSGTPIASPTAFVEGSFVVFSTTGNGGVAVTCTVNANHTFAGIFNGGTGGATVCTNLLVTGPGILSFTGNQGFSQAAGGNSHYAVQLDGSGSCQPGGSGQLYLEGTNSFSGGMTLAATTLVNFNNTGSFGTGPINMNSGGSGDALIPEVGGIVITNSINVNLATFSCNMVGNAAGVTYSGNINLNANTLNIGCGGGLGVFSTFSGVIGGTGGIGRQNSTGHGTVRITGANTYTGKTSIQSSVTQVNSLNSVTTPAPQSSSNLGVPSSVANGTLAMGATTFTGTLRYVGPGETTDRVIDLAGTTGGATIQAEGTGPLVFTSANTASGAGKKTLTLQGANTGANTIAGRIVDSSTLSTSVVKAQAGTWVLNGTNTYTGGTTISGGTLEIGPTGKVVGNVTNNAGTLQLDSRTNLASNAALALLSSLAAGSVNLNFSGTQVVNAIYIDGIQQTAGTWGSPTSGAANTSPIFTGTGLLNVLGAPLIVQQPVPIVTYPDTPNQSFTVVVTGDPSFTYQWKFNGTNIANATDSSYTIPVVQATDAGTYSVAITNNFGFTNSVGVALTVLTTNNYVNTVRTDSPVSYWRLGETNGTLAFDGIGGNIGRYVNALLNQPGFSLTDPDGSVGVPASSGRSYVIVTNFSPFVFTGAPAFSLEAWAYFTNLTGVQRIFSTLNLNNPNGYAFGINGANQLRFTAGAVADRDQPLNSALVAGLWYHLVLTCDGSTYHYYVNGQEQGSGQTAASVNGVGFPLSIGCNPLGYTNNTAGDPLAEQVRGRIDEAAIYNYTLSSLQVTNHYAARYGTLTPPVASTPVANPPSNYVSLSASIQAVAAGQALSYQWYKAPSTLLPGQTGDTLTLSPLQLGDAGNYFVQVTNPAGSSNSPTVALAVLPIPTNAADLNLTNNLVLHLAFDNSYLDISGHSNNGTNVGATTFVSPGAVGTNALHYFTDTGLSSFNYVTLGMRPDFQFGTTVNFTVSYWIRQPSGSTFTNLPFFTDAVGSTGHGGFAFAPYQTATTSGGWQLTLGSMSSPSQFTSFPDADLINDGNWHHLVHSADRTANVTTYLDGKQVDSQSIVFLGNINTTNAATIGQDPSGTYPVTASADIDDLAVWLRTVTPLEVSGIYLAGVSNSVSFAPPFVPGIVRAAIAVQSISGQVVLTWPGAGGALQASGDVTGTYTNVPGASSPYTNTVSAPQLFYRLKY